MKLKPIGDKVIMKLVDAEYTTKSGLVLTAKTQDKPQEAIVVAVGNGTVGSETVHMIVSEGDKVLIAAYGYTTAKLDGEEYIIMAQNDILAIIED